MYITQSLSHNYMEHYDLYMCSMVVARWKQQLLSRNEPRCPTCGNKAHSVCTMAHNA